MALTKLKKLMGSEGQAMTDESYGSDNMKDVLQAMAKSAGWLMKSWSATPATGVMDQMLADVAMDCVCELGLKMGVGGTAGSTTLQLRKNGSAVGSVTVDNADADGTVKWATVKFSVAKGDLLDLNVSALATGGDDLVASARIVGLERE